VFEEKENKNEKEIIKRGKKRKKKKGIFAKHAYTICPAKDRR